MGWRDLRPSLVDNVIDESPGIRRALSGILNSKAGLLAAGKQVAGSAALVLVLVIFVVI
jgi:hypothetical protein